MSFENCNRNTNKHTLYREVTSDFRGIFWISVKNITAVTEMTIYPKETGDYYIRATISETGYIERTFFNECKSTSGGGDTIFLRINTNHYK